MYTNVLIMTALCSRCGHYIVVLFLSFFFFIPCLISAVADWMSTILLHIWSGRLSANLGCRSEMCCTRLAENTGPKCDAKNRHLRTMARLCRAIYLRN